jgi:hypothetical protein
MQLQINEYPKRLVPYVPQPQQPQTPQVQSPTVFVYERQCWEYKVITRRISDEPSLAESELNSLGADGWELVDISRLAGELVFTFKRVRK